MKSNMTEKEARESLGYNLGAVNWSAVKKVFELEFEPEPIRLPERLELCGSINSLELCPEGLMWEDNDNRLTGYKAARDRYNAYPGLRAKANDLKSIVGRILCGDGWDDNLRAAHGALILVLEKGPK